MTYLLQVLYADKWLPLTIYFSEQKAYIMKDSLNLRLRLLSEYKPIKPGDVERYPRMKDEMVHALRKSNRAIRDFDLIEEFDLIEIPVNKPYSELFDI
jgi:hypothetical protein